MKTIEKRQRIPLLTAIGVVVVLVIAALVVSAGRRPVEYDPATPEGTAQGYLQAVMDGDERGALGYLAEPLQDRCRRESREMWTPEGGRAVLDDVYVDGETAEVDVTITETQPPSPLPDTGYAIEITLVMSRVDDGWAISEVPWPMWECDGRGAP